MHNYYDALTYVAKLHDGQTRKGTNIPYLTHLMTLSSYVFEFGGSEEQAIAGLLHDAIEDQRTRTSYEEIEARFGKEVCRIVKACTDAETTPKPPWKIRKQQYLDNLDKKDAKIKLVVACDKLHNAQSIVRDVKLYGDEVWKRFNASPSETLWYYKTIVQNLQDLNSPVVGILANEIKEMATLIR